ncbi:hypothetical protein [Pyrococcus horikoshii]|uniref:Uncharacterized protein n=2 Tax=Pyrococcus horikoshii TaxID=53953 RepID=O58131_PYRHO|nr:hypothetical protein [Pyrococcus horikoshii]BAA29469.1 276aa long hypothetical protein [Pyrococcus horikoshii OT3]HII61033.1 hypothetical protein [Pyrococcus horikoshii]
MNVYPLPVVYTFKRFFEGVKKYGGAPKGKISLLLGVFSGYLPNLPVITYYFAVNPSISNVVAFTIMFLLFMTAYEIGYIINDNISSRREGKFARTVLPLISPIKSVFYVLERVLILSFALLLTYEYSVIDRGFLVEYSAILSLMIALFIVYNFISTEKRAYGFLAMLRYLKHFSIMFPLILFAPEKSTIIVISLYSASLSFYGGIDYAMKKFKCVFIKTRLFHLLLYPGIMFFIFSAPLIVLNVVNYLPVLGVFAVLLGYSLLFYAGSKVFRGGAK